jgi:glycosyltransferase involved in cell wall biosynthesis
MPRLNLELWLLTGMNLFAKYVDLYSCPQVIHSHNALYAGALARKIKEEWRVPYVNTEHSSAYGRGLLKESELALSQRVFAESGAALVVSPQLGRDLEKVLPSKEITYKYVPNVLPRQFEEAQVELSNEHEQRPTGSNNFRFLNIASFDRNKAHADLLRAFAGQFGNAEGTTLRIGGDGPLRSELENLARKLGIEQRVVFLGKLSRQQVMIEMRTCDAFVLSSHYETFGVVLIEALACGKPVIATRCGGPETVVNETNGLLVPVNNLEALGQAMAEMKHYARRYDPAFLRAQCLSRFGEKTIVSQLETVYQETLEL